MKTILVTAASLAGALGALAEDAGTAPYLPDDAVPAVHVDTSRQAVAKGPFDPTWQSLSRYQVPAWYRQAKFGIWAHWGAQCQPGFGDWYARHMYVETHPAYQSHVKAYGHPSEVGFKDVIHAWKAEKWDPERLVALYKRVGAKYFVAMANHHDNFDNWASAYQSWNSVAMGPKKDLIAGWAKAARNQSLPFGVSVHASHAWSWYEPSQGADAKGPFAGKPYDGRLTRADGRLTWWEGFDPQELYAQHHPLSSGADQVQTIHRQWNWGNGASRPDQAYCDKFYNRVIDLIDTYQPELLYFDDTALPLYPVSDAGLQIAAHYYNQSAARHGGQPQVAIFGKILTPLQARCIIADIERGAANEIRPNPWQTDTCIGGWHYNQSIYDHDRYKSAKTVVQMLADIVSKNGNLLLNIPLRGDGSMDEKEEQVLEGIAAWMAVNRECIFDTTAWKVFGEGPASAGAALSAQGFNEGKGRPFTVRDVRFTCRGSTIYAVVMGRPQADIAIRALGRDAQLLDRAISGIEPLGGQGPVTWSQEAEALIITPQAGATTLCDTAVFRISTR